MGDPNHNERRNEERVSRTLFCQILCEGKRYSAVVLDVSPSGLFVRTAVSPRLGTEVEVTLRLAGGQKWTLQALITRKLEGGGRIDTIRGRGLGLQILRIPDGFSDFVASL